MRNVVKFMLLALAALILFPTLAFCQPDEVAAKKLRATQKIQLVDKTATAISETVSISSTHAQLATSKSVWDLFATVSATVTTDATLAGAGTSGSPLKIAQQSAGTGQVLKWNGTTWSPAADDNSGMTYTAGAGISIISGVIANTGDLSSTNEIQTYSHSGTTSYTNTLSSSGGSFTLNSGTGITLSHVSGTTTISGTASGLSKWTDAGSYTYLTATGDRVLVGSLTELNSAYIFQANGSGIFNANGVFNNQDANKITIGSVAGLTNYPGIWFGSLTPTISNYAFLADVGSSQTILNAPSGGNIDFRVGNSGFARGNATGLSIGTASNAINRLDVEGGAVIGTTYAGTNTAPTNGLLIEGRLGIGNTSPVLPLHVQGEARITGSNGTPTSIMGRDADGDISALTLGAGVAITAGVLSATNIYTADGTTSAARTVTIGANRLTFLTSNTSGTYPGLVSQTYNDGTTNNNYFTGRDHTSTDRFYISAEYPDVVTRSVNGDMVVRGATGVRLIAGSPSTKTVKWTSEGTFQLPSATPASPAGGELWYSSGSKLTYRESASTRTVASIEGDITGSALQLITSANTPGASSNLTYRFDANAGAFTVTLDNTLQEGRWYTFRCTRNATNVVTFNAGAGYSLAIDGDSALTPTTLTSGGAGTGMSAPYKIYSVRRMDTIIYIK